MKPILGAHLAHLHVLQLSATAALQALPKPGAAEMRTLLLCRRKRSCSTQSQPTAFQSCVSHPQSSWPRPRSHKHCVVCLLWTIRGMYLNASCAGFVRDPRNIYLWSICLRHLRRHSVASCYTGRHAFNVAPLYAQSPAAVLHQLAHRCASDNQANKLL